MKWFSDSQYGCGIAAGSSKPHLQGIAVEIFNLCMRHDIEIELEWIPRDKNEKADYLSRIVNHDGWSLNPLLFQLVDSRWGPHTVDRFSSFYNA